MISPAVSALPGIEFDALLRSTSGIAGLGVVFLYSFLIAFAFPGVSEVVLATPLAVDPDWLKFSVLILTSAVGKALGSLLAFHIGQEAKGAAMESGRLLGWLESHGIDLAEWSRSRMLTLARRWGYAGLALGLSVPGFPDTVSIYAFAVLERDYAKFAAATFAGSVGRLVLTLALFKGLVVLL